jgi:hypothetical protein
VYPIAEAGDGDCAIENSAEVVWDERVAR